MKLQFVLPQASAMPKPQDIMLTPGPFLKRNSKGWEEF